MSYFIMNFNYKESLDKNGKKDSNSEPNASQSNSSYQTTSLESVEQQTITKSTNETANKQTELNTTAHSIENIIITNRDALGLTAEHLQEADTTHTEWKPKWQQNTVQRHVHLERPGPSQFKSLQTAEPLEQHHAAKETLKQLLLRNKKQLGHVNLERSGPSQFQNLETVEPLEQHPATKKTLKQHLLQNKRQLPKTLSWKQDPQKKCQKISFDKQYNEMMDLPQLSPQPQNSPTGVSLLNKELIINRESPTTHQETYYTHLKLTKPQTQFQIQESAQTQLRKQQLSSQDISHLRPILPRDSQEKLVHQQSFQNNPSKNISPNPQVQLPSHEHQKECLPSYLIDNSNFISLDIESQPSLSTNLSQSQTSSLHTYSQQSQIETQLNSEQASRESLHPRDFQSIEVFDLQMAQSPNLQLNISSQLTQSQTSPFLSSSQQSQKETQLNPEQARSENMFPCDLQSLDISDHTQIIDQTLEELLSSFLTNRNEN